jgi:hypothetical protein
MMIMTLGRRCLGLLEILTSRLPGGTEEGHRTSDRRAGDNVLDQVSQASVVISLKNRRGDLKWSELAQNKALLLR